MNDNTINTMIIDSLRAQLEELRNTCLEWSRQYSDLLRENEELREKLSQYQ